MERQKYCGTRKLIIKSKRRYSKNFIDYRKLIMKRFFYDIFVQISLLLMNISFIIKSHYLCALVIWLNLRKYRDIRYKEKIRKKLLFFQKWWKSGFKRNF